MTRNELIESHLSLVPVVVKRTTRGRSFVTDSHFDDLLQEGAIALMEAAATFDPSRGVSFKTHAWTRIRYRTIEEMRSAGTLSGHGKTIVTYVPLDDLATPSHGRSRTLDVRAALARLTPRERRLINHVYWRGDSVQSAEPHLTKAGASYVHRAALAKLRQGPLAAYRRAA